MAFSEIDGGFVFLPAGLFDTFDIRPGIVRAESGVTFDGFEQAPREGYVIDAPVPLEVGGVYAVRSRSDARRCVRYGKFEVLDLDPEGLLEFRFLRNNLCNDRRLILPELPDEE
ncbi:MAG: hypothetical protein GWM90_22025 [Gemmatimonadetes bacterium]|nr:hypothetical protein [Gemmatimonadota bacterium]NIQ57250.1 hypothetical protein [Gemmatimonadota bacterium]NIU77415.1 hypothetical protein [Gammaproteobacteria bacterium]NIX46661.1 hypothetical protein [Gemmatimonadota bacterium]NIY10998.1 hypothetical protein [Gemmatimonadota bacterium]